MKLDPNIEYGPYRVTEKDRFKDDWWDEHRRAISPAFVKNVCKRRKERETDIDLTDSARESRLLFPVFSRVL
jgi:hypothetical protein